MGKNDFFSRTRNFSAASCVISVKDPSKEEETGAPDEPNGEPAGSGKKAWPIVLAAVCAAAIAAAIVVTAVKRKRK